VEREGWRKEREGMKREIRELEGRLEGKIEEDKRIKGVRRKGALEGRLREIEQRKKKRGRREEKI